MINNSLRLGRKLFFPRGNNARLAVLTYHRVLSEPDSIQVNEVDIKNFDWQMETLSRYFNVFPLDEALDRLYKNSLPEGSVSVTFDDGYLDNLTNAAPILKKWNITATLFVATSYLDGGIMWNDMIIESLRSYQHPKLDLNSLKLGSYDFSTPDNKRVSIYALLEKIKYHDVGTRIKLAEKVSELVGQPLPGNLMLTSDQVSQLADNNFIVGGHTHTHPILSEIDLDKAEWDIKHGLDILKEITESNIRLFAYPNGVPGKDYFREHTSLISKLGFDYAVTTAWGTANSKSEHMQIPRISPWDRHPITFDMRISKSLLSRDYSEV